MHYKKADSQILKLRYDTELLITGKKSSKSLKEKYIEEKSKNKENKKKTKTNKKIVSKKQTKFSFFWILVGLSSIISLILILVISILNLI